jgi:hypothetical protein
MQPRQRSRAAAAHTRSASWATGVCARARGPVRSARSGSCRARHGLCSRPCRRSVPLRPLRRLSSILAGLVRCGLRGADSAGAGAFTPPAQLPVTVLCAECV